MSAQFDWLPTFAQAAGLAAPARTDGVSLLPTLLGQPQKQNQHTFLYMEYRGQDYGKQTQQILRRHHFKARLEEQAVHLGNYVGLRYDITGPNDPIRLYNVVSDPKQLHNLAGESQFGSMVKRMQTLLITSHTFDYHAPRPYDDVPLPAVVAPPHTGLIAYTMTKGRWPWTPRSLRA